MAFIGFGHFSKYYTYIFVLVAFRFLCDYFEGFNEKEYYKRPNGESFIEFTSILAYHPLIRDFMYFLGAISVGLFFYIIYIRTEKENIDEEKSLENALPIKTTMFGFKIGSNTLLIIIIS